MGVLDQSRSVTTWLANVQIRKKNSLNGQMEDVPQPDPLFDGVFENVKCGKRRIAVEEMADSSTLLTDTKKLKEVGFEHHSLTHRRLKAKGICSCEGF